MADYVRYGVQKLDNENYSTWSYKVQLLLTKDELWSVVKEPKPADAKDDWIKKDDQAKATIGLLVEDNQLRHIKNKNTAHEQWNALKDYHQKSTLCSKLFLYKRIFRTILEEDGNMEEHVTNLLDYIEKLSKLGQDLSDDIIASVLLGSLPESYDTLITALESRPESDLTSEFVKTKLINEYDRRKGAKDMRETACRKDSAMKVAHKDTSALEKRKCFFCKRIGHSKHECLKYKAWKKKQETANNITVSKTDQQKGYCFMASSEVTVEKALLGTKAPGEHEGSWLVDSGTTSHMANSTDFFKDLDSNKTGFVRLADDNKVAEVKGIGKGDINCVIEKDKISTMHIQNVLYVPKLASNLLSVKKLAKSGHKLIFEDDDCLITKNGKIQAVAKLSPELYEVKTVESANMTNETTSSTHNKECQHIWHRRFGHRDPSAIKQLVDKELATGISIKDCGIRETCECCVKGKMARTPFPKESKNKTQAILDLIHTDVCGPMHTETPSKKRYILTMIDDYSRYSFVYFLKNKSEAATVIKEFVEMTKTQFNKRPKIIRSDQGREYVNDDLQKYLKSEGIRVQYTAAYSPQQNGVAERKNRSLLEMARCMLLDASLDKKYWAEAVNTANFLQNRLPTKIKEKTPYELWHLVKPDVKSLHVFGSQALIHIPKELRKKLDEKAEKLVFVGYSEESKALRFLNIETNRIRISRDVVFIENHREKKKVNKEIEITLIKDKTLKNPSDKNQIEVQEISANEDNHQEDQENQENSDETSGSEEFFSESEIDIQEDSSNESIINDNQAKENRRSERNNRGVPPDRYMATLKLVKEESEPRSAKDALSRPDKDHWKNAMNEEIESLKENKTWEIVTRPEGKDIITCKWVFKTKRNAEGNIERYKARLVARGFSQKYGTDYDEVFAPVVKQTTFRTLLTVAGHKGMIVKHFDAKTAFLNGELKESIYMQQPEGCITQGKEKMVCRLRKGIYGLKQAAKVWNDQLNDCLKEYGFLQSKADLCLYIKTNGQEKIYLIVYVDDFLIAAKDVKKINEVADFLSKKFQLKDLGALKHYLGMEVRRDTDGIFYIKQSKYIDTILKRFSLQDAKISNIPMDQGYVKSREDQGPMPENKKYQQLIGALLYLSVNTRPDIAASITILSQHNKAPNMTDWNEVKRVARYLKGTKDYELRLGKKGVAVNALIGYADADWAENRVDRKSNSGYIFQLYGSPISWGCRKQPCVSLSSTVAEYVALAEATQEGIWIRRLFEDFEGEAPEKILIYEDNQSCLKLIDHKKFNHRTKHIDTKFHFIKDIKNKGIMEYEYCPTAEMIADMLTKPLGRIKLKDLAERCGLIEK